MDEPMAVHESFLTIEKPCPGCGIPAEFCEPETCPLAETIRKAANIEEAADEEYILITFYQKGGGK